LHDRKGLSNAITKSYDDFEHPYWNPDGPFSIPRMGQLHHL
jgi:hypothetical protein